MRYKISHITTYSYSETVPVCHNEVHLTPRDDERQHCVSSRLSIKPEPATIGRHVDYFGNFVSYFTIQEGHHKLSVAAISKVDVTAPPPLDPARSPAWESVRSSLATDRQPGDLAAYQFVFDSPYVGLSSEIAEFAAGSFPAGRPLLEGVVHLTERIHREFAYDPSATHINTPLEEVLRNRKGVCQDFAHLEIACLRSLGLAARYVSGYLLTNPPPGQSRLIGSDASHAWLSVYCPGQGWFDFDPTNGQLPTSKHITLAWGRDYGDVCPIKGVFVGGGQHGMSVSVDVAPLEPTD